MGKPDRPRIVGDLRVLQGAPVERDRARLIAAGGCQAAVQAPERGKPAGRDGVPKRVGRTAEAGGGLLQIVLQQPRLGERGTNIELVLPRHRRRAQRRRQQLRSFGATAPLERGRCTRQQHLQRCGGHEPQYRVKSWKLERRSKRSTLRRKAGFEACAAVAVAAGPWFGTVQIAAPRARMSVLHLVQDEELLPVLTFFEKWRRAEADLDPPDESILAGASVRDVAKVFVAGDRALAECSRVDRRAQRA